MMAPPVDNAVEFVKPRRNGAVSGPAAGAMV